MLSNCLIFALKLCLRRAHKGRNGYIAIRRSRWGGFPHLLYAGVTPAGRLRLVNYVPVNPTRRPIPPPLFRGRIKWGDKK